MPVGVRDDARAQLVGDSAGDLLARQEDRQESGALALGIGDLTELEPGQAGDGYLEALLVGAQPPCLVNAASARWRQRAAQVRAEGEGVGGCLSGDNHRVAAFGVSGTATAWYHG